MEYEYDVALSYAGENREYVLEVASQLKASGIKLFYDDFNETELWGEDLVEYFDDTFRNKAKFCVIFISQHYAEKAWPSLEKRSALARSVIDKDYIWPARFDDVDLLGLPPTKKYIDLNKKSPAELAEMIIKKLGKKKINANDSSNTSNFRRPKLNKSFNPYQEGDEFIRFLQDNLRKRCDSLNSHGFSFSSFDKEGKKCLRVLKNGNTIYSLDISRGGISDDKGLSFHGVEGEMTSFGNSFNAWGSFKWSKSKNGIVLSLHDMSLIDMLMTEEKEYTSEEFLNAIWNKICDTAEVD